MAYTYIVAPGPSTVPFRKEVLFVTEGIDDAIFLEQLLTSRAEDEGRIEVRYSQGNGGMPDFLKGFTQSPAFTQRRIRGICVIVDADDNPVKAENTIKKAMAEAGLPVCSACEVTESDDRWTGLYILPKKGKEGMLEDLLLEKIGVEFRADLSKETVQRAIDHGLALDKIGKRTMQILLAVSEGQISRGPGQGVRNGVVPFDPESFDELNDFLTDFLKYR